MTDLEKIAFKQNLKQFCEQQIQLRIASLKTAIENARESANQEEKSTVGDKYETARSMGQLEQDMYAKQLAENVKELSSLQSIDSNSIFKQVVAGAFIQCNSISFFIAAGLGKKIIGGKTILFLSPNAPLAKKLMEKNIQESFLFNNENLIIEDLF